MINFPNFKVNDAWVGLKVTDNPFQVQEGKVNAFVLMDVASTYVIDQQVAFASEKITPPIEIVEAMFMKAYAKAFKYPLKLYVPTEEAENNGFVIVAKKLNIPVEYVELSNLREVIGPVKSQLNKVFGLI